MGKPKRYPRGFGMAGGKNTFINRRIQQSIKRMLTSEKLHHTSDAVFHSCQALDGLKMILKSSREPPTTNRDGYKIIHLEKMDMLLKIVSPHMVECPKASYRVSHGQDAIKLVGSTRDSGLAATLTTYCLGCGHKFLVETSPMVNVGEGARHFDINVRGVWAQMATGGGASKLNETMSIMGIGRLSSPLFTTLEEAIGRSWQNLASEDIRSAAEEERRLAEEKGQYHQGVPAITVVCDGGWSKRSHKHSYNALGGVGIVIGLATGKVLHVGVRNKICYTCMYAENHHKEVRPHDCYGNWTSSSQAMEADIMLEAFSMAEPLHGLRYMEVVADGDGSTLSLLRSKGPPWCREIRKLECANHSVKCLRGSLERIVSDHPEFKGKHGLTKSVRVRLTTLVRCSIRLRTQEADRQRAIGHLQNDIIHSIDHVFGWHDDCSPDVCKAKQQQCVDPTDQVDHGVLKASTSGVGETSKQHSGSSDSVLGCITRSAQMWTASKSLEQQQESRHERPGGKQDLPTGLKSAVLVPLKRMAAKAGCLIGNHTTNLAEAWMSLRLKFDGGKVINRCGKCSWTARCFGATIRKNLGPNWSAVAWQQITGTPPGQYMSTLAKQVSRKQVIARHCAAKVHTKTRQMKRKASRTKQDCSKKARLSYGAEVPVECPDLPKEQLEQTCENFYQQKVVRSAQQLLTLEQDTRQQGSCENWHEERRIRLTSSHFGDVLSKKPTTKLKALTERLLYNNFQGNTATRYGLAQEAPTRKEYELTTSRNGHKVTVKNSGLVINPEWPYIGASPDGIVCVNGVAVGLLEMKNVLRNKPITFADAAKTANFCLETTTGGGGGALQLRRRHKYFAQCQGLIQISGFPWLDFVVRSLSPYQLHVERIQRDDHVWKVEMLPKLRAFYFKALLPELAAPRHGLDPGIREPGAGWMGKTPVQEKPPKNSGDCVPSTSSLPPRSSSRLRSRSVKFVGRRISHEWIVDEGSDARQWYTGTVLRLLHGTDGMRGADYEVKYDGESGKHCVNHIVED